MYEKPPRLAIVKTRFLGTLFPKLPSSQELEARRAANIRRVVQAIGGVGLRNYVTEEDLAKKRLRLGITESMTEE